MADAYPGGEAAIREQAYYFWEQDGRPEGREAEYWSRAVAAVTAPKRAAKPASETAKKPLKTAAPKLKAAATKVKAAPTKSTKADPKAKPKKK